MAESDAPPAAPPPTELASVFHTQQVRRDGDRVLYVGDPLVSPADVEREVWSAFRERGFEPDLRREPPADTATAPASGWVLVAKPHTIGPDGIPWTNVVLALLTLASTLLVGAVEWYRIDVVANPLATFRAWPFVAAILGVLAIHESGHYVASRYHRVDASLPYFIPIPTLIGTMGAVIKMKGRIPSRKALFDIGAAGPIAGLVATVVVTAIGLQLDPLPAQQAVAGATEGGVYIRFNDPPLLQLIAAATGTSDVLAQGTVHPVVFGGWVGMLITLLNLLPVGQLDGGHIVRAMAGTRQRLIASAVPGALFALAAYLYFVQGIVSSVGIWALWALMSAGLAYVGPADPIEDDPLDRRRMAVGVATFAVGVLCFTPIPFEVVSLSG